MTLKSLANPPSGEAPEFSGRRPPDAATSENVMVLGAASDRVDNSDGLGEDSRQGTDLAAPGTNNQQRDARGWRRRAQQAARSVEWLFGLASLVLLLAIVATLPVLQLMSLGYLLEVSGRVARGGRLRDGFVGVRKAARVGGILLGLWLLTFPLRLVASLWSAALLIDPRGQAAIGWMAGFYALTAVLAAHAVSALLRGGRLRSFLIPRPIRTVRLLADRRVLLRARDGLWELVAGLRLPHYFVRGAKGFFGGFAWLVAPTALLATAPQMQRGGFILGGLGAAMLFWATVRLPLLEAAFAAENRWQAFFEPKRCRLVFARAPLAFALAIVATLVLSTPLLALKIEMIPREAAWLPSILFVVTGLPARLAMGWAWGRAARRPTPRHWFWRWSGRLIVLLVAALYVLVTYLSQFLSWHGVWSLCEQHAFLLPAPFFNFDF